MANYTAYIPAVGSITYATQISNFITVSEAIDTELENARNGEATLLDSINLKLSLIGGTLTGNLVIESDTPVFNFVNTGSASANEKRTRFIESIGQFRLEFSNDAETSHNAVILIDKLGNVASNIGFWPSSANGCLVRNQIVWNAGNHGTGSTLDADLLDGIEGVAYARLDLASTFTTIPAFNGGTSGVSAPFTVDSTQLIPSLNADLLDGIQGSSFARLDSVSTFTTIPAFNGGTSGVSAPFTVDSSNRVINLNADHLDDQPGSYYAPITSPTFAGLPFLPTGTTGVTQTIGDTSTKLATTAYVDATRINMELISLPDNYLYGLTLSNGTDTNNDIDIAVGGVADSSNTIGLILTSIFTKQLDVTWAVGTAAGGLFSGSKAADTTYHVFVIEKDSDGSIDTGFDTSVTAANIPIGYTNYRRIGSVVTNSSANIYQFTQVGNYFNWNLMESDFSTAFHTSRVTRTLRVPTDIVVMANVGAAVTNTNINVRIWFGALTVTDFAPSTVTCTLSVGSANSANANSLHIETNTSGQIATRCSTTGGTLGCHTIGYIDNRGQ